MTRLSTILTVFLGLTVALAMTAFQIIRPTVAPENIIGTYSTDFSGCCDGFSDKLIIKKQFHYERIYSANSFALVGKWTISGTWTLKHDTLITTPIKVKRHKGTTADCSTQKDSVGWLCNADTLIFKDNILWTDRGTDPKSLYKYYIKK